MSRYKPVAKKIRLAKKRKQTKWAPFWIITRIHGLNAKVHPSQYTSIKRHWKRTKTKA